MAITVATVTNPDSDQIERDFHVGDAVAFTRSLHIGDGSWPVAMHGTVTAVRPTTALVRINRFSKLTRIVTVKRAELRPYEGVG